MLRFMQILAANICDRPTQNWVQVIREFNSISDSDSGVMLNSRTACTVARYGKGF